MNFGVPGSDWDLLLSGRCLGAPSLPPLPVQRQGWHVGGCVGTPFLGDSLPTQCLSMASPSPQILQADGGNYCASVNAATLAVIDAGIPMRDYVCASSAGFIEDTPLADLNYVEEAAGGPQLALALLPKSDQIALLEMNARLHEDHLERIVGAASKACKDVYAVLDQVVQEHLQEVTTLLGK